jgi:acetate kinase
MTPLEGLMMGTRAGSIDPGILLTLLRDERVGQEELSDALEHRSGLLAVSGSTSDMAELTEAAARGDERASLAIEMFVVRAAAGISAAATSLARLDALAFTGGIGEHAAVVRGSIVDRLAVLGVAPIGAEPHDEDGLLGPPAGGPAVFRIEAREDLVIAAEVESLLGASPR